MSVFIPPDLPDKQYQLFGVGGGQILSEENSVPLLAKLPLEINNSGDKEAGIPIVFNYPNSYTAKAFQKLVSSILDIINNAK